jgi:hypothetical protein
LFRHRAFMTLATSASLLVAVALPAWARSEAVQTKSVSGVPNGKSGTVVRFADRTAGNVSNSVTISADDADGPGSRCTETWIDYSTNPHEHFNPGVLVNCSGGNRSVSGALRNNSRNVQSMGVIVCDVPNTTGSITRNSKNCRGQLGSMGLHSGQRYDDFRVNASQSPSGINIYRI